MNINTVTHALVAGKAEAEKLERMLLDALQYAHENGLVATIENKAIAPLAQGNHEPWVSIFPTKDWGLKLEELAKSMINKAEAEAASIGSEIAAAIKKDFS